MANLVLDKNVDCDTETDSKITDLNHEELENYKGIFYNNDEDKEILHEFGAHFSYKEMCMRLEKLKSEFIRLEYQNESLLAKEQNFFMSNF